ncbi:hypothetical protein WN943_005696 [Citrus x changshan-huyou]
MGACRENPNLISTFLSPHAPLSRKSPLPPHTSVSRKSPSSQLRQLNWSRLLSGNSTGHGFSLQQLNWSWLLSGNSTGHGFSLQPATSHGFSLQPATAHGFPLQPPPAHGFSLQPAFHRKQHYFLLSLGKIK